MVPATFVTLDAMPLTPTGKVDRRSLPAPDNVRPLACVGEDESHGRTDGGTDAIELRLRAIWEGVLGVAPIGRHDNFFDLGGHSLLAVRLFREIQRQFAVGALLPLATLFEAPTIAELASVLREQGFAERWSPLVVLQPQGALPPMFLIHEGGGNVLRFRSLARHLAPEQPVYALQAIGLSGSQPPHDRIEDMAALYIQEIRRVQPRGPYRLGGASFGGVVAYEMAQQLVADGQEVALLALFDSNLHPRHMLSRVAWLRFQGSRFALHARNLILRRQRAAYVVEHTRGLRRRVRGWLGARLYEGGDEHAAFVPASYADVWEAARRAYRAYEPRPYPGRITLFRAMTRDPGCPADPAPDWQCRAGEGVQVIDVPGGHMSILVEPNAAVLAERLREALLRAATVPTR
jgi:thioesterase domain-containing protein